MKTTLKIIENSKKDRNKGYHRHVDDSQLKGLSDGLNDEGVITPKEVSELQGSLQELNNDKIDHANRTSGIDLRTRLYNSEIASITVLDTLVQFNFLPISVVPFTLQKKRLAVSLKGKGRDEIVGIVQGKREDDQLKGGKGLLGGLFKNKEM